MKRSLSLCSEYSFQEEHTLKHFSNVIKQNINIVSSSIGDKPSALRSFSCIINELSHFYGLSILYEEKLNEHKNKYGILDG